MATVYTPLLYHSNYGVGGSCFKTLFEYLNTYNIKSCGIADETFFGLPEFIRYAKIYNIKPAIGARVLLPAAHKRTTLYLFVKNQQGYRNLCRILTKQAFTKLDLAFIKEHATGLVLLSHSIELLRALQSTFKDLYYLVLPYHTVLRKEFPPLAAQEIFYVTRKEKILHKLMCAIKDKTYECMAGTPHHLLTDKEFSKLFTDYPEAIMNNQKLAKLCTFVPENKGWIFPQSKQRLYEIIESKCHNLNPHEKSRIRYEYQVIEKMGFAPHFSLVYHLKEFALSKGIGMNVRGSAASSFILYILGLSVVDPLQHNLPFERFLNPQRTEPPDIDVDVEFSQRERLIQEIYKEFGSDYVAHISVINRFRRRARFRDTARAYGIAPQELQNIEHHLGEKIFNDIYTIAQRIDNYPHYFSCHASGIVITPQPISEFVPLYPSPAGHITHFDKDGIEMVGLVKIDILGVRGFPSLFLSKEKINFNDPNVYRFIGKGKTLGCFQIESPMVRQVLKKIKPKSLMDIANAIAVIRPGPAQGGMKERFLKRLKGKEKIDYPHPRLQRALHETLGISLYQEQILQIAHDFAHFSLSDGDMLRRAMTKERNSNRMEELEKLFFTKAEKMGYSRKEIEIVWDRVRSFSSFGFNKAHSITYATLAYLSAYQKLYSPSEFFCRVINNKGGYYPTYAYINEARRWRIKILPPDVNKSETNFIISRSSLITGLSEIKNLSIETIKRIIRFRPYKHGEDFFYRVQPAIDEGIALIQSGALDTLRQTWPGLYLLLLVSKSLKKYSSELREKIPQLNDFRREVKLKHQLNTINFLPDYHVLEIYYPERTIKISDLVAGSKTAITGTLIAGRTILTKNKKLMSFLTIDDETGTLEVVVFPNKYRPHAKGPVMEIEGTIEDDSLIADNYTPRSIPSP